MKDQFWPVVECWDGWRVVRIGSPVVVLAGVRAPPAVDAVECGLCGRCGCRGTTLALCEKCGAVTPRWHFDKCTAPCGRGQVHMCAKFRADYMMEGFPGTGYSVPSCGHPQDIARTSVHAVAAERGGGTARDGGKWGDRYGQIGDRRSGVEGGAARPTRAKGLVAHSAYGSCPVPDAPKPAGRTGITEQ